MSFEHQRHQPPTNLERPRELILACQQMRSSVNASRIVRAAGCMGVTQVILEGNTRLDEKITRDALEVVQVRNVRTLAPALEKLKDGGHQLVGLEQTSNSESIFEFQFKRESVLIVGNERLGVDESILRLLDRVVEIPIYGYPLSLNAATSAGMALYEYCRQFPVG